MDIGEEDIDFFLEGLAFPSSRVFDFDFSSFLGFFFFSSGLTLGFFVDGTSLGFFVLGVYLVSSFLEVGAGDLLGFLTCFLAFSSGLADVGLGLGGMWMFFILKVKIIIIKSSPN